MTLLRYSLPALSIFLFLVSFPCYALPDMVFNDLGKPIALVGISDSIGGDSGCSSHIGTFLVNEVTYLDASDVVNGIRVSGVGKNSDTNSPNILIRFFDLSDLSNHETSWMPMLVSKGSELLITYGVCGQAGFNIARDIYQLKYIPW